MAPTIMGGVLKLLQNRDEVACIIKGESDISAKILSELPKIGSTFMMTGQIGKTHLLCSKHHQTGEDMEGHRICDLQVQLGPSQAHPKVQALNF